MYLSVVIPVKDEARSLPQLYKELTRELKSVKKPYELIFVDDGSSDKSNAYIRSLKKRDKTVRLISFYTNHGKSAALSTGFSYATGAIHLTLDADLQDNPRDISAMLKKIESGYDFVIGWRKKRNDSAAKLISSRLFNKGTSLLSGVSLHDFNCGIKMMKSYINEEITLHGELHRFMPVLAAKRGYRVTEVVVHHRARKYGRSKYGFERGWKGIVDLSTALFLTGYITKPAHFFSSLGFLLLTVGFGINVYVTGIKILTGTTQGKIPLILAGVLSMMVGVQLVSTGLIGEMIISMNRQKHPPHSVL